MAIAFAVMVVEEVVRCSAIPFLSERLQGFMSGFADDRDAGPVFITHIALLLGIAIPMWLAIGGDSIIGSEPCSGVGCCGREGRRGASASWLLISSGGLISLGLGDTAASVVGVLAGRTRLLAGSSKTLEGTLAGTAAMILGSIAVWILARDPSDLSTDPNPDLQRDGAPWQQAKSCWPGIVLATFGAAFFEAVTLQMDNLVVPLYYTSHLLLAVRAVD